MKKRHKILIVDDAAENIDILVSLLKDDYKVAVARNGERALEMAGKNLPDLILLDIIMPGMDGYDVCKILKSNDRTKHIPVIFITALSEAMDEAEAFRLGAVDYVTKPFIPVTVKARVKNHIDLKEKTDMLEQLVLLDGLTGINNRRKFDEMFASEWKRTARQEIFLSLVLMDIDFFKNYNDNYGHASGDECLRIVADCMKGSVERPGDILCRYGGEEFGLILPGTDLDGAVNVADKLRKQINLLNIPHEFSPVESRVTISAGAASTLPHQGACTPRQLLEAADQMLYEAKKNGRNRVSGTDFVDPE